MLLFFLNSIQLLKSTHINLLYPDFIFCQIPNLLIVILSISLLSFSVDNSVISELILPELKNTCSLLNLVVCWGGRKTFCLGI